MKKYNKPTIDIFELELGENILGASAGEEILDPGIDGEEVEFE